MDANVELDVLMRVIECRHISLDQNYYQLVIGPTLNPTFNHPQEPLTEASLLVTGASVMI
jgi:hypothetical protein